MRIRAKLKHTAARGWHVDLPTYAIIPGTVQPLVAGGINIPAHQGQRTGANIPARVEDKSGPDGPHARANPADPALAGLTVEVEVPDDYQDPDTGTLTPARVRQIHRGHPRWDDPAQPPDV